MWGCFGTDYSATYGSLPLAPQRPGINVLNCPQLLVPHDVVLMMRGRLVSCAKSCDILHLHGPPFARVRGRASCSKKGKHVIELLDGTPLLNVQKACSFRPCFQVHFEDESRQLAAEVRKLNTGESNVKLGVYLRGQKSKDPALIIKGNHVQGEYYGFLGNPKRGGQKVLAVTRTGCRGRVGGGEGLLFEICIAANTDIGLMLAIVTAIDGLETQYEQDHLARRGKK